jgi:hypothetical protein
MTGPAIHRCQPPPPDAGPAGGEMWYCPDCGRGWETTPRGDWTPAGRSPGDDKPSGPTSGFLPLRPGFEGASARLIEGNELAESLVGLDVTEAVQLATERGFEPRLIPHTVEAVTADLRLDRIRLFLDDTGVVVQRASAG